MVFSVSAIRRGCFSYMEMDMNSFNKIRVLELGRVFSAPLCGMMFGDIGAEVIKIEKPVTGDESRHFGDEISPGQSCYFNSLNRNKRSMTLDLKNQEDKVIFIDLIRSSDVLIHNWVQSSLDKLGFSYDEVNMINPRIIYCSISGYGYKSRFRDLPSQDIIAQSLSGLMSLTGEKDGLPMKTGIPMVDYTTGLYAGFAVMSALYQREKSGKGMLVHTSLLETALAVTSFESSLYLSTGKVPSRNGNRHPYICPYGVYRTLDGVVTISVANDDMWVRFCNALHLESLKNNEKFKDNNLRLANRDELEKVIEQNVLNYKTADIIRLLKEFKVSCGKVNNIKEAFNSEEVAELEMIESFEGNSCRIVKKPFHLEGLAVGMDTPPPAL